MEETQQTKGRLVHFHSLCDYLHYLLNLFSFHSGNPVEVAFIPLNSISDLIFYCSSLLDCGDLLTPKWKCSDTSLALSENLQNLRHKWWVVLFFVLVSGDPVVVSEDEEYKKVNFDKFTTLKSVFQKDGMCIWLYF